MECGARVALGVGAGYLLGRSHKMRWALMLAAAGATGRLPGRPGELLDRGTKALESSPELSRIIETARDRLLEPGKAAIMATTISQIDSLSERLQTRAASSRQPGRPRGMAEEEEAEQPHGRARPEEDDAEEDYQEEGYQEEGYEEEGYEEEQPQEEEPEPIPERPVSRRGRRPAGPGRPRREARKLAAGLEEEAEPPRPRRTARVDTATTGSPIRRTGRRGR